jgi:hypothetical protein
MQYGLKANGRLEPIYGTLGLSQAGQTYEARIDTQGIPDENMAITQILQLENEVPDLKVTYVETNPDGSIIVQFRDMGPGQFAFEAVLAFLPQVLFLGGIIALGITLLWVIPALQGMPSYVWYVAAAGGVMLAGAILLGLVKLPSVPSGVIMQERQEQKLATQAAERSLEETKRQEERTAERLQKKEENIQRQRNVVKDKLSDFHKIGVELEHCSEKLSKETAAGRIDATTRTRNRCIKLAEQKVQVASNVGLETDELKRLIGEAGSPKARMIGRTTGNDITEISRADRTLRLSKDPDIKALTRESLEKLREQRVTLAEN